MIEYSNRSALPMNFAGVIAILENYRYGNKRAHDCSVWRYAMRSLNHRRGVLFESSTTTPGPEWLLSSPANRWHLIEAESSAFIRPVLLCPDS